jgi:hypothetical protein
MKGVIEVVRNWIDGFKQLPHIAQVAIAALGGIIAAVIALDVAINANAVSVVVLAIAALVAILIEAYRHIGPFRDVVNAIGTDLVRVGHVIRDVAKELYAQLRNVGQVIVGIFEFIKGAVTLNWHEMWKGLKDIFEGEGRLILTAIKGWINVVADLFPALWKQIELRLLQGIQKVVGILAEIPNFLGFHNPFKGWNNTLKSMIANLEGPLPSAAIQAADRIKAHDPFKAYQDSLTNLEIAIKQRLSQVPGTTVTDASTSGLASGGSVAKHAADTIDAASQKIQGTIKKLWDQLKQENQDGARTVADLQRNLQTLQANLTHAQQQLQLDVTDATRQAKQNLTSIGDTIAQDIGTALDKPIQVAQDKISLLQAKLTLSQLRQSVILPGGKQLSTDPKKAIAQLQALEQTAGGITKASIQSFLLQYQSQSLQVRQDQVNRVKDQAQRRIDDLAYAFNTGHLTAKQLTKGILAELKRDGVNWKTTGEYLGKAFVGGFQAQIKSFGQQAQALRPDLRPGITGYETQIVRPLTVLHNDQRNIENLQRSIASEHNRISNKIDSNTKRAADTLAKIHAEQAKITQATSGQKLTQAQINAAVGLSGVSGK